MKLKKLDCRLSANMITQTMLFREKLRRLMDEQRYNAIDVAREIGMSDSLVYRWLSDKPEDAKRGPTTVQILTIARLFKVSVESLIDVTMQPTPSTLPADEKTVLDTYRYLKMTSGLDAAEASVRMSGPTPPFKGVPPQTDGR